MGTGPGSRSFELTPPPAKFRPSDQIGWSIEFLQGDGQAGDATLYQQAIDDWMNDITLTDEMCETFLDDPDFAD